MVLENTTKNIDYRFCKEFALFENDISTIKKHDISKFASMKEKSGYIL